MPWSKFDDGFHEHPKTVAMSDKAFRLFTCAITYSSRHKLAGRLTCSHLAVLFRLTGAKQKQVEELVTLRSFDRDGDAYLVHGFSDYNPDQEEISRKRAEAGREGAKARWQNGKPMALAIDTLKQTDGKGTTRGGNPEPDPNPVPERENPPPPLVGLSGGVLKFKTEYPYTVNVTPDEILVSVYYRTVKGLPGESRVMQELAAWKHSPQWDDPQYIPSMETFLTKPKYRMIPPVSRNGAPQSIEPPPPAPLQEHPSVAKIRKMEEDWKRDHASDRPNPSPKP